MGSSSPAALAASVSQCSAIMSAMTASSSWSLPPKWR